MITSNYTPRLETNSQVVHYHIIQNSQAISNNSKENLQFLRYFKKKVALRLSLPTGW
jgi:hypothetical protein